MSAIYRVSWELLCCRINEYIVGWNTSAIRYESNLCVKTIFGGVKRISDTCARRISRSTKRPSRLKA